ncbi:hypothetical protein MATL_G00060510 [Megalops atlanticus]|uniref:Coiled-coil domain containing 117 n=1 Tax=Megalops atlanticus TaxID=7932 RepID=A0A9D3Q6T0_MEGAT|nr:hypothetical protein MATL_G00060510 [Megalops atlanticus]
MHRPGTPSSELGFLPPVYPISGLGHPADQGVNRGGAGAMNLAGASVPNTSWEKRCLRKHRRRPDDEACSAKRRRLSGETGSAPWDDPSPKQWVGWAPECNGPTLQHDPSHHHTRPASEISLGYPGPTPPQPHAKVEGSCMDVEAAQRHLQEIEERITLEDDDEEEDLDVEPAQNRPVLVMSQSLREGLQRGLGDILPQTIAESVSRSCMELVVWRPPEEALPRRLKDSLQRQRKQTASRQTTASSAPQPSPALETGPLAGLYCSPSAQAPAEEEMEL